MLFTEQESPELERGDGYWPWPAAERQDSHVSLPASSCLPHACMRPPSHHKCYQISHSENVGIEVEIAMFHSVTVQYPPLDRESFLEVGFLSGRGISS